MGLTQASSVPSYFSYNEVKGIISELNSLFQQNKEILNIELILIASRFAYSHTNWKRSTVPGKLTILKDFESVVESKEGEMQESENVVLSLQGVYQLYSTMKHLKSDKKRPRSIRASKELNQKIQKMTKVQFHTSTPNNVQTKGNSKMASYIDPQQGRLCCICFQKMSTCALPCLHLFCDVCTIKYIIEKEQKKCPICRQVFEGTSQKVAKEVYTVIQQEQQVNQQIRKTILGILSVDNSRIINKIRDEKSQLLNLQRCQSEQRK